MYLDKRFLAVVPARGGSKGVPGKNIRLLATRPLLDYTAAQIAASTLLDAAVVSTDDPQIAAVAGRCGLKVVERPPELALDTSPTEPSLLHALDVLEADGGLFDYVVVLEPTSPFRSAATIDGAIRRIVDADADSLLAVRETRENIGFLEGGWFRPVVPGAPRRRQARTPFYVESSTIYICRVEFLRRTGTLVAANWAAFVVADDEAMDINTPGDFALAEYLVMSRKVEQ